MKHLTLFETFTNKVIIGVDIDGTINNFYDGYNLLYKRYFPDNTVPENQTNDWFWYQKLDYNGIKGSVWFNEHKAEIFEVSQPYSGALESVNNIYDFIKTHGFTLNFVTNQPTEASQTAAKEWLDKYGFKYDNVIYAKTSRDKWKHADIMIDDAEKVIGTKPLSKVAIKIEQLWNDNVDGDFNIPDIKHLTIDLIQHAIAKLKNKNQL
jgi:hypothetical protein